MSEQKPSAIEEQKALNEYLSSLDPKELMKTFEREKKSKRINTKKEWTSSLRKKIDGLTKAITPDQSEQSILSPKSNSSKQTPIQQKKEEELPLLDLPNSNTVVKFLLYNIDVCVALLGCVIDGGKYHELCGAILKLFRVNRVEHNLITFCLQRELKANTTRTTLFRDNTPGTTLLSAYCKIKGLVILKELVSPFLHDIMQRPLAIEPDPNRCNEADAKKNVTILSDIVDKLLEKLYTYHDKFPSNLMSVFQSLHRMVILKYPEVNMQIIGGFFFLRFFCPVLIDPTGNKIISEQLSATARRTIVIATKIIQNISNGLEFGKKETFMIPFNNLISKHIKKTSDFLEKLANPPENGSYFIPKADQVNSSNDEIESTTVEIRKVVSKLIENAPKIKDALDPEVADAFISFYNGPLQQIDKIESIGWKTLEERKQRNPIEVNDQNLEFGNISRDAFLLAREALCQCEEELSELRSKLEEERLLRFSMQHIIQNMAESIHFRFDENVQHHVQLITSRRESSDIGDDFCELLFRKSTRNLPRYTKLEQPEEEPDNEKHEPSILDSPKSLGDRSNRLKEDYHNDDNFVDRKKTSSPRNVPRISRNVSDVTKDKIFKSRVNAQTLPPQSPSPTNQQQGSNTPTTRGKIRGRGNSWRGNSTITRVPQQDKPLPESPVKPKPPPKIQKQQQQQQQDTPNSSPNVIKPLPKIPPRTTQTPDRNINRPLPNPMNNSSPSIVREGVRFNPRGGKPLPTRKLPNGNPKASF